MHLITGENTLTAYEYVTHLVNVVAAGGMTRSMAFCHVVRLQRYWPDMDINNKKEIIAFLFLLYDEFGEGIPRTEKELLAFKR